MRFGAISDSVSSRMNGKIGFVTPRMKQKLTKVSSRMNNSYMSYESGKVFEMRAKNTLYDRKIVVI